MRTQHLIAVWAIAIAFVAGCSKQGIQNDPVNAGTARESLQAALESWKKGEPSNALEKATPPIYVVEPDWQGGAKLKDFQIVGSGEEKDAQWNCNVRLTLVGANGQEMKREVTFTVATAPNRMVSRKLF